MQHCFLFNFDIILIKNFIGVSPTSLMGVGVSPRVGEGSGADPEFKRKGVHQEIINGEQTAPTSTNMQDPPCHPFISIFVSHFVIFSLISFSPFPLHLQCQGRGPVGQPGQGWPGTLYQDYKKWWKLLYIVNQQVECILFFFFFFFFFYLSQNLDHTQVLSFIFSFFFPHTHMTKDFH